MKYNFNLDTDFSIKLDIKMFKPKDRQPAKALQKRVRKPKPKVAKVSVEIVEPKKGLVAPIQFQPKYKVLFQDEEKEIRLYPPCRRTISINYRQYYLPFPHLIFIRLHTDPGFDSYWNNRAFKSGMTHLFMGLTTADVKKVYQLPLSGVAMYAVCLDSHYHYDYPGNSTFEELIKTFWATNFNGDLEVICRHRGTVFGGRFHAWANMTFEEVENDLPKLEPIYGKAYTFKQFKELQRYR